jgi:diacylglycerol kinase (ATP)
MKPPLLVVNPACGSQTTARVLPQILESVERAMGDVAIRFTASRGHATELAYQGALEGHPLVVGVGGDGTLSEVINGVLQAEDSGDLGAGAPPVGLINAGTGGDFRRSLGLGPGHERSLEALALGRERLVDVGRATFPDAEGRPGVRYFINVVSAGLGGLVDRYIERIPGVLGGKKGYYLASLRAVLASQEQPVLMRVEWHGETRQVRTPCYLVAVCNGRWFGGGMDIAPMALVDDGRLEVVTITERTKFHLIGKMRLVYDGRHLEEPTVGHFPCQRIEIRLEDQGREHGFLLDVDGDPLGSLPLTVEIQPRRLRIRS